MKEKFIISKQTKFKVRNRLELLVADFITTNYSEPVDLTIEKIRAEVMNFITCQSKSLGRVIVSEISAGSRIAGKSNIQARRFWIKTPGREIHFIMISESIMKDIEDGFKPYFLSSYHNKLQKPVSLI